MKLIDLSRKIQSGMPVYPGDMQTRLFQVKYLDVNGFNDHRLEIGMHSGTHVDSPMHLTEDRRYISEWPLDSFIGAGCILDVRGQELIESKAEYTQIIKEGGIVLLYTGYDSFYGTEEYYSKHPSVDMGFCKMLAKKNVKMLGIDAPSIDKYPFECHKALFKDSILIIENLMNLGQLLNAVDFEVMALPLAINADSSMTRAVARVNI